MKFWQLSTVLAFEKEIFKHYFQNLDTLKKGKEDVDEVVVQAALSESKLSYYVTSNNYLRLMPEDTYLKSQGVKALKIMSVLEAYQQYGADAITEVIDYGSFELK